MKFIICLILFTIGLSAQTQKVDSVLVPKSAVNNLAELRQNLNEVFEDPNFNNAFWGVSIQSLDNGETLFSLNQNKSFKVGSLIKLFTSSTALLLLGPDYSFKTEFYTDGKVKDWVLDGNLIIRGGGDPSVFYNKKDAPDRITSWIDSLRSYDISSIKGNIICDDRNYKEDAVYPGWITSYENNWFAPPTGAFCVNENSVELIVKPSSPKYPAELHVNPTSASFEVINRIITVPQSQKTSVDVAHKRGSEVIRLSGFISESDDNYQKIIAVNNPTEYFALVLYEALTENGIQVTGFSTDLDSFSEKRNRLMLLFEDESNNLASIVDKINKNSNNFFAEQLLKTLGHELYGYGNRENGIKAVTALLEKMGINPEKISIYDGSGLSTFNLASPQQFNKLLFYMYKSDAFETFYNSLALAGFSGTLADRMNNTKAENNFRGKSGSLENVKSLAGYIKTADGEPLAITLIVNNFLVPSQLANYIQDKVCNRLANFKRN